MRPQSTEELDAHLTEQLAFLTSSCLAFDLGVAHEVKRIAGVLRILLHSSGRSTSLLQQMSLEDLLFVDSSQGTSEESLLLSSGLVHLHMADAPRYVPLGVGPLDVDHWMIPFASWWNDKIIVVPHAGFVVSRRAIVLTMANKDGGAHVDSALPEWYAAISRDSTGAMEDASGGAVRSYLHATVRQVAFEVLHTLRYRWRVIPSDLPDEGRVMYITECIGLPNGRTREQLLEVPHSLCPCRSGLDYATCHAAGGVHAGQVTPPAFQPAPERQGEIPKPFLSISNAEWRAEADRRWRAANPQSGDEL